MKRIIVTLAVTALALATLWAAIPESNPILVIVPNPAVPLKLGTDLAAKTFVFVGCKGVTNNSGRVWIQTNPTNNIGGIPLQAGQVISVTVPNENRVTDFWIGVETTNDGCTVTLFQ